MPLADRRHRAHPGVRVCATVALMGGACAGAPDMRSPSAALARDTRGYAMASCFARPPDASLRDQGYRWAGGIIELGAGPIEAWTPIADAVAAELKRSGIARGKPDGPAAPSMALPVMTCGQIADSPGVAAAIDTARRALASDYRARR